MVTENGWVVSLRARDGKENWRVRVGESSVVSPLIAGSTVVASTEEGNLVALRGGNGQVIWRNTEFDEIVVGPVAVGRRLLVADNRTIRSVKLDDGRPLATYRGKNRWVTDLVTVRGKVLAGDREGQIVVLDARTLEVRGVIRGRSSAAPPAIGPRGEVVIGYHDWQVQCYFRLP